MTATDAEMAHKDCAGGVSNDAVKRIILPRCGQARPTICVRATRSAPLKCICGLSRVGSTCGGCGAGSLRMPHRFYSMATHWRKLRFSCTHHLYQGPACAYLENMLIPEREREN